MFSDINISTFLPPYSHQYRCLHVIVSFAKAIHTYCIKFDAKHSIRNVSDTIVRPSIVHIYRFVYTEKSMSSGGQTGRVPTVK